MFIELSRFWLVAQSMQWYEDQRISMPMPPRPTNIPTHSWRACQEFSSDHADGSRFASNPFVDDLYKSPTPHLRDGMNILIRHIWKSGEIDQRKLWNW